ncbi:glucokinase [Thiomicrorhabdus sp.]|uniref:glucokinase n=1 Tax=Thiomicrorhabdus sp. TaxID=2039724 RepID=UPI0029C67A1A|nr:glucokinase [Thiomicrorhabdus sp.]
MARILAGDVGGTKTVLAIYQTDGGQLQEIRKETFPSGQHSRFEDLLLEFLGGEDDLAAAVFGIAGPIKAQRCVTTNLPWIIDAAEISAELNIPKVHLLNDLESAAYGILRLDQFYELNPHADEKPGHIAVIAAGTGLGEAILFFDGREHHAMPTEGGHCEFAPQNAQEDQLLLFLRERFNGHVSMERILSGNGFGNLYDFLKSSGFAKETPELEAKMQQGDRNAAISIAALKQQDALCQEAMRLFCRIYGTEAGNLALKSLPLGGVYIAGGIAPKIRSALEAGEFMQGFLDKGRMKHAIEQIPVRIVDNPEAPLLGAAHFASKVIK